jgi:hypothetical protein
MYHVIRTGQVLTNPEGLADALATFDPSARYLAVSIRGHLKSARSHLRMSLRDTWAAGRLLLDARKLVPQGQWRSYLIAIDVKPMTAWRLMQIAQLDRERLDSVNTFMDALKLARRELRDAVPSAKRLAEEQTWTTEFTTADEQPPVEEDCYFKDIKDEHKALVAEDEQKRAIYVDWAKQIITIGYRALAMKMHPDKGGTTLDMQRLGDLKRRMDKIMEKHL